jgi:glycosyltransferase involved in cell wall biosynthesis
MKVSVIMIFLNGETFIRDAIDSVFSQTYPDWELLLVDDGSSDRSTQIALEYAAKYPEKVRYLEHDKHQNRGMSASRNLGISHAEGKYIGLLDADDIWLPQKLTTQVEILARKPEVGMVYGATKMWFSWTGSAIDAKREACVMGVDRFRKLGVQSDTIVQPPRLLELVLRGKAETPGTCSILTRKEVVEKVGGFEESFRGMFEDQAFLAKVLLKTPVFVESGCWDRYRQHNQSSCYIAQSLGQYSISPRSISRLNYLNWLQNYLSQEKVKKFQILFALWQAFLPYKLSVIYAFGDKCKHLLKHIISRKITRERKPTYSGKQRKIHEN